MWKMEKMYVKISAAVWLNTTHTKNKNEEKWKFLEINVVLQDRLCTHFLFASIITNMFFFSGGFSCDAQRYIQRKDITYCDVSRWCTKFFLFKLEIAIPRGGARLYTHIIQFKRDDVWFDEGIYCLYIILE